MKHFLLGYLLGIAIVAIGIRFETPVHAFDSCTQFSIDLLRRVENVQQRMRKDGLTQYANELRDIMAGDGAVRADRP